MLGDPYFSVVVIESVEWKAPILEYPEKVARAYNIPLISMVICSIAGIHQLVHVKEKGLTKRRIVELMNASSFEDALRLIYFCVNNTELLSRAFFGENNECAILFTFHLIAVHHLGDKYYGITIMAYD